ncbi:heparanase-like protein 2 [Jatropha curcas]|uniref:heparanase-like protein 2 n=1 Tax=Jatropha curcas TaxID=180498 RepID=UPI0005FC2C7D|nr:heparanase-like protein 2 [Jatropha curcas]
MANCKLAIYYILVSWFSLTTLSQKEDVRIVVKGKASIAKTDDSFVCATLDWWPSSKCNYDQCPWGETGLFTLDLENKILANAIKAFNPLRIRVGGSLQDELVYRVGKTSKRPCPQFQPRKNGLMGFTSGCLTMERWDQLHDFFNQTRAKISFGLNALIGRRKANATGSILWVGSWNPQNAHDLMKYSISKGYEIDSYELGNELCSNGVDAKVEAGQYAKDMIVLKKLVHALYPDPNTRPKVLGPGGFFDPEWFQTYLRDSGPNVVSGITHHIYNLGSGADPALIFKVQDPYFLNGIAEVYAEVAATIKKFGPWAEAWVGEGGGAFNSGSQIISHSFSNGFWYLDQLGISSIFNHKVFCRQSLIGGNYGLLNTTTFIPNPDYYGALLWHRLMGKNVLATYHAGSPYLKAYSHCSKQKPGITLLLMNLQNSTSFYVMVSDDENPEPNGLEGAKPREEYHLTPKDGDVLSDVVLLNETPLLLTDSFDIPAMNPKFVDPFLPIIVKPNSIVFVVLRDFNALACS